MTRPMQQAWLAKLMQYDYEISYMKGKQNVATYSFSQVCSEELHQVTIVIIPQELLSKIEVAWQQDPHLQQIITAKEQNANAFPKY